MLQSTLKIEYKETDNLQMALGASDVVYMTRIQKERFPDPVEYEKVREVYILTKEMLQGINCKIMHPLPRVNEISKCVDNTKNAIYFEQAKNGVVMRQALLALLLGAIK